MLRRATKLYGAALYRMRESDFNAVEHENGISPAWPIGYSDLEPYYERAEKLYRVHGSAAGDMTEPPRAASFPHPPIEHAPIVAKLVRRIEHRVRRSPLFHAVLIMGRRENAFSVRLVMDIIASLMRRWTLRSPPCVPLSQLAMSKY